MSDRHIKHLSLCVYSEPKMTIIMRLSPLCCAVLLMLFAVGRSRPANEAAFIMEINILKCQGRIACVSLRHKSSAFWSFLKSVTMGVHLRGSHHDTHSISLYFFQHMNELHSLTDSCDSRKRKGPSSFPLDASRLLSGASSAPATLKCASWNTP